MSNQIDKLSTSQKVLFDKVINEKKNIFFTGCGGTGKSFVLKCIIDTLRSIYPVPGAVAVTGSTGKAAFNITGTTLHSFAGVGLGKGTKDDIYKRVLFNRNAAQRWEEIKILIVDEISMIDGELFDKLEYIATRMKKNNIRFGGIQLVLVGDLLQLPPVNEGSTIKKMVIEAGSWKKCIDEYILLTEVFRQKDMEFIRVLACIRVGAVTDEVLKYMKKLEEKKDFSGESGPVELFATKNKTEVYNKSKLDQIKEPVVTFIAKDIYVKNNKGNTYLLDSCQAPPKLELKKGAQVMLVKNVNKDLVNGTVGLVLGFTNKLEGNEQTSNTEFSTESLPIVRFDLANGKTFTRPVKRELWESVTSTGQLQASRRQIPLILAWAVTIHKSQGQTIQRLRANIGDVFEAGQMYTALSRAVSPDTLEVIGFDPDRVKVNEIALEFCLQNNLI